MACTKCPVGDKTTITFATSGFTAEYTQIGGPEITRTVIETDTLGSHSCVQKCVSDKINWGEVRILFCHDADIIPPFNGPQETIVITWPPKTGQTNGGTFTFTGQMRRYKVGDATPNNAMISEGDLVVFCDPSDPVFAPGS